MWLSISPLLTLCIQGFLQPDHSGFSLISAHFLTMELLSCAWASESLTVLPLSRAASGNGVVSSDWLGAL